MCSVAEVRASAETVMRSTVDRHELIMRNRGLVRLVVGRLWRWPISRSDLMQFGYVGLCCAAERFDPARGVKFSTYAVYWIKQFIYNGVANTNRPIRVEPRTRRAARIVGIRAREMSAAAGREHSLAEAASTLPLSAKRRERLLRAAEADVARFGVRPLERVIRPARGPSLLSAAIDAEHREQLGRAMNLLSAEHREVLALRYGLDGDPPLTPHATAARLGIHRRAADRRERAAIEGLRRLLHVAAPSDS